MLIWWLIVGYLCIGTILAMITRNPSDDYLQAISQAIAETIMWPVALILRIKQKKLIAEIKYPIGETVWLTQDFFVDNVLMCKKGISGIIIGYRYGTHIVSFSEEKGGPIFSIPSQSLSSL